MLIRGLLFAAATSLVASAALAQPQLLSLDALKAKCHEFESNDQYLPFSSQFTCSEERTFWVKRGSKPLPLPNSSEVRIKALIKGNQHQTDWWSIPGRCNDQVTSCDMFEQVRGIARVARSIKNCAELDQIVSEQEFCKDALLRVWDSCAADMANGQIGDGHSGACEYIPSGVMRGCAVQPAEPTSTTSVSTSSDSSVSTTSVTMHVPKEASTTSSSSEAGAPAPMPAQCPLGAEIKVVKAKDGMFNHRMVQLEADPSANSMLSKLNLSKGDVIASVNGKRVQSAQELESALRAAKARGAVTIKFRDHRGTFLERTRAEI